MTDTIFGCIANIALLYGLWRLVRSLRDHLELFRHAKQSQAIWTRDAEGKESLAFIKDGKLIRTFDWEISRDFAREMARYDEGPLQVLYLERKPSVAVLAYNLYSAILLRCVGVAVLMVLLWNINKTPSDVAGFTLEAKVERIMLFGWLALAVFQALVLYLLPKILQRYGATAVARVIKYNSKTSPSGLIRVLARFIYGSDYHEMIVVSRMRQESQDAAKVWLKDIRYLPFWPMHACLPDDELFSPVRRLVMYAKNWLIKMPIVVFLMFHLFVISDFLVDPAASAGRLIAHPMETAQTAITFYSRVLRDMGILL